MRNRNFFILFAIVVTSQSVLLSCNLSSRKSSLTASTNRNVIIQDSIFTREYLQSNSIYKSISLPFDSEQYLDDCYYNTDMAKDKYPIYQPADILIDNLRKIDYEGEEYQCFIIASNADRLILLIWIPRGDSEYYLIVTIGDKGVISWYECGYAGDDNPIMFSIDKSFLITKYRVSNKRKDTIARARIEDNGKIVAINN